MLANPTSPARPARAGRASTAVWSDGLSSARRQAALTAHHRSAEWDLAWLNGGSRALAGARFDLSPVTGRRILEAISVACRDGAAWLLHPAAGPLTGRGASDGRVWTHFLAWTAHNAGPIDGRVDLDAELRLWTPEGIVWLPAGEHDFAAFAAPIVPEAAADPDPGVGVDLAWDALPAGPGSVDLPQDWRSPPIETLGPRDRSAVIEDLRTLFKAQRLLARRNPEILAWIRSSTHLCFPICRGGDNRFASASRSDLAGGVFLELRVDWRRQLEGLVHESAHLQLFADEQAGPLVDPGHARTYASPLRPEPRPLRGILLAYHALAYMAALYDALGNADGPGDDPLIRRKLQESRETLLGARDGLTDRGRDLVRRTELVCDHVGY